MAEVTRDTRPIAEPLLTTAEMYRADSLAMDSGVSGLELMENAGRGCADAIIARYAPGKTAILCGAGNNGGDGFVIARLLEKEGWEVTLALLGEPGHLKGDAAEMFRLWGGSPAAFEPSVLQDCAVVVDAIFGAGLSRPVDGVAADMIGAVNASDAAVVAIDVPSGIDGTTGRVCGTAVNADVTVTFFRKKTGHVLTPGRWHCGEVEVVDIGIPDDVLKQIEPRSGENTPRQWLEALPLLNGDAHKYSRGHAVVVTGPQASTGAARLGARASLRVGAGLVSVASPLDAVAVNAAQLTAIMVKPFDTPADFARLLDDGRINAVLVGPGGGVGVNMRALVRVALASGAAVVLDADALTSFERLEDELREAIAEIPDRPVVITPHQGEFGRLMGSHVDEAAAKQEQAVAAAAFLNAVVVLKGADTVVADGAGTALINTNAPASLATAGSGDVLAGLIAGLLAQHMAPLDAAAAAVWMHGDAAARFGPGLIAEDLPELIPHVLDDLDEARERT